ncbi:MAG TPA: TadE/TadG family type IV pilus assembly protein [Rickettsiales bacterium]|nr:TadE/TadG family type IV pilus assembly protein [Rickettsiales bacterium]
MASLRQHFRDLLVREEGLAYLEFALSISLMLMMFMGSVEISRCLLITQKLEKVAASVADVTTQTDPNTGPVTTSQMSQLMSAVTDMMSPYTTGVSDPKIKVIVTDITKTGSNSPVINWQYCGGGALSVNSSLGTTVGSNATLPSGFTMSAGEEVVIGEVYYSFTPIISNNRILGSFRIYRYSIYVPRLGALTGFSSHC